MKKLDTLLLRSFIGPFVVTFAIAIFVLLMQILWVYLDEIAGKGVGFFLMMELIAYKCVGLVPLALPLALLISSVMVLGSLAEHYELTTFKTAGVRLIRIMLPLILVGAMATVVSYLCSDYLIPVSNLQFGSRMYDIQQKKPTLSLEAGAFNEDFSNYAIRIGSKDDDGRHIQDVMIYDHAQANSGRLDQIVAEDGEMYGSPDGDFFIMQLNNGYQYGERGLGKQGGGGGQGHPFIRTQFKTWSKVFDLSEFNLRKTNQKLFSTNRSMMSSRQLAAAIDSIDIDIKEREQILSNHLTNYLTLLPRDTATYRKLQVAEDVTSMEGADPNEETADDRAAAEENVIDPAADTLIPGKEAFVRDQSVNYAEGDRPDPETVKKRKPLPPTGELRREGTYDTVVRPPTPSVADLRRQAIANRATLDGNSGREQEELLRRREEMLRSSELEIVQQSLPPDVTAAKEAHLAQQKEDALVRAATDWPGLDTLMAGLPEVARTRVYSRARSSARSIYGQAESAVRIMPGVQENRVKHVYDMHMKYSMAVICIIFVFIGAPMGAIVRKGGFGYPILISIIFFVLFVILTIFCRKLAESFVVNGVIAGWLPCIILFPMGWYLTVRAMNDSKLVSTDSLQQFLRRIFPRKTSEDAPV
ncbi:MAG: LptF/LptG family permease [Saprospiraceae bacterium]